jgi:hypothetical protein
MWSGEAGEFKNRIIGTALDNSSNRAKSLFQLLHSTRLLSLPGSMVHA